MLLLPAVKTTAKARTAINLESFCRNPVQDNTCIGPSSTLLPLC